MITVGWFLVGLHLKEDTKYLLIKFLICWTRRLPTTIDTVRSSKALSWLTTTQSSYSNIEIQPTHFSKYLTNYWIKELQTTTNINLLINNNFCLLYRLHKQYSLISTSSHRYYLFEATALTTADIKMTLGHFIYTVGITFHCSNGDCV